MRLLVLSLFAVYAGQQVNGWGYEGSDGPTFWGQKYPDCNKKGQSPIEVKQSNSEYTSVLPKFVFSNYDATTATNATFFLKNNGHTAVIVVSDYANMRVTGFGDTFRPWQIHFHWGKNDKDGSEHRTRDFHHPAEMHFVHVNTKYSSTSEALNHQDGLMVFGTIMEISTTDTNNVFFDKFLTSFGNITYKSQNFTIPAFALNEAFTVNTSAYFHYNGSLTTPTCNEAVLWVVFKDPIFISNSQMKIFRAMRTEEYKPGAVYTKYLVDNYRPLQERNGRKIFRTFSPSIGQAINIIPSISLIMASLIFMVKFLI